jgi:amino-acid N-acetyltransferase
MRSPSSTHFVSWFRSVAPYIHAHNGKTFVIACAGEVLAGGLFTGLTHDLALLNSLGIRVVLVHGARPQIDGQLAARGSEAGFSRGMRITNEETLECVKQAVGILRVEIEAQLSVGLPNSLAQIRVADGSFITAMPAGVIDGVDFQYAGKVRKVDVKGIEQTLENGAIVLLSPLGYSPTGQVFNLAMEDVATSVAIALDAEKLVFLCEEEGIIDDQGALLRELTARQAERFLKTSLSKAGRADSNLCDETLRYVECAVRACQGGVARVHLVSRKKDGAALLELFTRQGVGTMVSEEALETMRQAEIEDVGGIVALIEPLEEEGVLVKRSREVLETEIDRFVVLDHDNMITGCAGLYPFPDKSSAELACLAVRPEFRNRGGGDRLLSEIEQRARAQNIRRLFVLTTQTGDWFIERGFVRSQVSSLPNQKRSLYNYQRRSQVYVKKL